jgi:MFS family permease
MDESTLQSLGFTWPTPAYLFGMVVFSLVGYVAFRYGRKRDHPVTMWIGVALMLYPYVVSNTWLMYIVGAALCIGIWFDHRN